MCALRSAVFLGLSCTLSISGIGCVTAGQSDQEASARWPVWRATATQRRDADSGWRRTDEGWFQIKDRTVSSSRTEQAPATQLHPSLVAVFVLLVSAGVLWAFEPAVRQPRGQVLTSDQMLVRDWAQRLRRQPAGDEADCL